MVPQLIFLGLNILGLGLHLAKHGEPTGTKYNFFGKVIVIAFAWYILYLGGFWNELLSLNN